MKELFPIRWLCLLLVLFFLCHIASVSATFARASNKGPPPLSCPSGSFFDLIRGGECWKCPAGYSRTIWHVESESACEISAHNVYQRATRVKTAGCFGDEFLDPSNFHPGDGSGAECWTCPTGFHRTLYAVTDSRACSKWKTCTKKVGFITIPYPCEDLSKATYKHKAGCQGDSFWDPNGGCYTCPAEYSRTVFHVDSADACSKRISAVSARATKVSSFFCTAPAFLDWDGNCWQCPATRSIRTLLPVSGDKACTDKWYEITGLDLCPLLLNGAKEAAEAVDELGSSDAAKALDKVIDTIEMVLSPVLGPAEELMDEAESKVMSQLEPVLVQFGAAIQNATRRNGYDMLAESARLQGLVQGSGVSKALRGLLLSEDLCSGKTTGLIDKLLALGMRPNVLDPCPPTQIALKIGLDLSFASKVLLKGKFAGVVSISFSTDFIGNNRLAMEFGIEKADCDTALCFAGQISAGYTTSMNAGVDFLKPHISRAASMTAFPRSSEIPKGSAEVGFSLEFPSLTTVIDVLDGKTDAIDLIPELSVYVQAGFQFGERKKKDLESRITLGISVVEIPLASWPLVAASACSVSWAEGSYGICDAAPCKNGTTTRTVWCKRTPDGTFFEDQYCKSTKPATSKACSGPCTYAWREGAYGPCSAPCDSTSPGKRTRAVQCYGSDGQLKPDSSCSDLPSKPVKEESCTAPPCAVTYAWNSGYWNCSVTSCGEVGPELRDVECLGSDGVVADDSKCTVAAAGEKPAVSRECTGPCFYEWELHDDIYSNCTATACGEVGTESCEVLCFRSDRTVAHDSLCVGEKPICERSCNGYCAPEARLGRVTVIYSWVVTNLTGCSVSECGAVGTQLRSVSCESSDSSPTTDDSCIAETKPATEVSCTSLATCVFDWAVGDFEACSGTKCGEAGTKIRKVVCTRSDRTVVLDDSCDSTMRPSDSEPCVQISNTICSFDWDATAFSDCSSTTCEEGIRTRNVTCMRSDGTAAEDDDASCSTTEKPHTTVSCIGEACEYYWGSGPFICQAARCGAAGLATREVACMKRTIEAAESVSDSECTGEKPVADQDCVLDCTAGVTSCLAESASATANAASIQSPGACTCLTFS